MKGKLSFMWRVAIALVLVLSLGVVMAAPVSAAVSQPEVTVAPTTPADASAVYTIEFTTNEDLASGDAINIEFPTGTTGLGSIGTSDVTVNPGTITVSDVDNVGQRLSITLGATLDAGDITVVVGVTNKVTNPSDGDCTLDVYTSQEPTAVTSETYIISRALTGVNQPTLTPTALGAAATYAIPFTTSVELRTGDAIVIEFPVDTDISAVVAGDVTGVTVPSTSVVGQVLTITLGGSLAAGTQTVTIADHIINPTTLSNPDPLTSTWNLTVYTTYGHRIPVESAAYTLTDPATAISQVGWSTVDEYVPNATPSDAFVIQTQTQYGNAANVAAITTFTLTASSGAFYEESGCTTVITTIVIAADQSDSDEFFYKGATATVGTVTITADEETSQGWTVAETTILVNPKLELWGGGELKASYATFALAIAAALPYDTIKVAASTYGVDSAINVNVDYLTISGAATTILDSTNLADDGHVLDITADGVTIDGLKFLDPAGSAPFAVGGGARFNVCNARGLDAIDPNSTSDGVIQNCIFDGYDEQIPGASTDWTIRDNDFLNGTYGIRAEGVTTLEVSDNTFTQIGTGIFVYNDDTIITGNTFTDCGKAVTLWAAVSALDGVSITGNTITGSWFEAGIIIWDGGGQAFTNLTISRNTITGSTLDGIWIEETAMGSTAVIQYNDISGNGRYGINSAEGTTAADCRYNYWGSPTGPLATANPSGTGDAVNVTTPDMVLYSPWLNAPGGGSTITDTSTLVAGWNLISLPLIPVDADIDTVLAGVSTDVTVNKVAYYTGGPAGSWKSWFPSPTPIDLYTMNDGKGYWIDVSGTGTLELAVTGVELALPGYAPPTYDVVVGWNLIGFTSITGKTVDVYLGSVLATVQAMYLYNASSGAYTAVITGNSLVPGSGYWLAVDTAGKIYP